MITVNQLGKTNSGVELLSGAWAGVVGTVIGYPLDTVKVF